MEQSSHDNTLHSQENLDTVNSNTMEGRTFASLDNTESNYRSFAHDNGFAVRLGKVERDRNGAIRKRTMLCTLAQTPATSSFSRDPYKRPRVCLSTCCSAYCRVSKDAVTNQWKVIAFSNDHNHPLVSMTEQVEDDVLRKHRYNRVMPLMRRLLRVTSTSEERMEMVVRMGEKLCKEIQDRQESEAEETSIGTVKNLPSATLHSCPHQNRLQWASEKENSHSTKANTEK